MGFDMFSLLSILFPIFFLIVLGIILFQAFAGVKEWSANNRAEKISAEAIVVAKRINVSSHMNNAHTGADGLHSSHTTQTTTYYVTFQLANGERLEFHLKNGAEYGSLVEQDLGVLTYQGTRYLDFKRQF